MSRGSRDDVPFVKVSRACGRDGLNERWAYEQVSPTLNVFDNTGGARAVVLVMMKRKVKAVLKSVT